jgi:3-methyladenine DNA glycosylase AlkD
MKKMTTKTSRALKVSLSESDSKYLKQTSERLGITETEVLRKGLKLMLLYADSQDCKDTRLVLENNETRTELMVL